MKRLALSFLAILMAFSLLPDLASAQQQGLPVDGKDFYIAYVFPSFNINPPSSAGRNVAGFFNVMVLITSYEPANVVKISYFDAGGKEVTAISKLLNAKQGFSQILDRSAMQLTEPGDIAEFKACHITSKKPVNVQYFSTGACSGGSYLAIPTNALGKKYVIPSYPDNRGYGAATNSGSQGEFAGGFFVIVAAFDGTAVQITPNGKTKGGHTGVNSGPGSNGSERPYSVTLQRGQCYWVKGDGSDESNDMSGSIIVASKPVAVIAGHEDAFIGDVGNRYLEARDFMIEEVIPAEYWDNKGYVNIPLKDTSPQDEAESGYGENFRVYTDDARGAKVDMINGNGTYNMFGGRFSSPTPEKDNVGIPVDFASEDGHNFGVMLYDNRGQGSKNPYPAASMMSIVPMSRWRTSFLFFVPANTFEVLQNYFINVIGLKNDFDKQWIKYSFNGSALAPLTGLSSQGGYIGLPNHPELKGVRYSVSPGTYYLTNTRDAFKIADSTDDNSLRVDTTILRGAFMVYHYGMRAIDPDRDLGDFCGDDNFFSYALPIGMTVSSPGGNPTAKVDTFCSSWHVCVHDSIGIASVTLLDDPGGNFYRPGKQYKNVRFDPLLDPEDKKEINFDGNDTSVCFDVFVSNPLDSAFAPLFIIDTKGKHIEPIPEMRYRAPHVFLANQLTPNLKIDTLIYPVIKVGQEICSTLVYINTDQKGGGKPIQVSEAKLKKDDGHFKITSTIPTLPATLKGGDTLKIQICFNPNDSLNFDDTITLKTDCFDAPLPIVGGGATPLIYATDIDFGDVVVGGTSCKELTVSNRGKLDFLLTKNWLLHNTNLFNMDVTYAGYLPHTVKPGESFKIIFCYSPKAETYDSTTVDWNTDIDKPFTDQIKSWSYLKGHGIKPGVRWDRPTQLDSVICDDEVIVRVNLLNSSSAKAHVDSVFFEGPDSAEYRMVGNQLGYAILENFELDKGDKIWVDVAFKADLSKVGAAKYANRQANLVATYVNPEKASSLDSVKIAFTGKVRHSNLTFTPATYSFGFVTKGVPVAGFVDVTNNGDAPFVVGPGGVLGVIFPNPPVIGISMNGKALQTGDSIRQGETVTLTIDAKLDVYTDTTLDYTINSSEPCGDFPAKIQIATSSLLVTGTGFPAPETFVTCRHADGIVTATNRGSFTVSLESVEIIGAAPAGQFDLKDASGALTQKVTFVGKLLAQNDFVNVPIVYHPTVSGPASATIQYTFDSSGKKIIVSQPATGIGAQLRTTLSAVQANGQPYTGETSSAFDVPISLTTTALTPAAGVKRATFTFTYRRDVVNFQSATPKAGYIINNTPTPVPNGTGDESIFFDISSTGAPIVNLESVVSLNYQVMVAKEMISPLVISDVKFYDGIDPTPICYVAADTIPGVFIPNYLCGDTTLHNFLSNIMPTRIAKLSPSVVNEEQDPILYYSINRNDVPVKVEIFNVLGQHVRTIKNSMGQPVGDYKLPIGIRGLQSGSYTVRLTTPTNSQTANFILQK